MNKDVNEKIAKISVEHTFETDLEKICAIYGWGYCGENFLLKSFGITCVARRV